MKNLIPTDFSKLSKVGVRYAVKMAKKLDAEVNRIYLERDV